MACSQVLEIARGVGSSDRQALGASIFEIDAERLMMKGGRSF